MCVRSKKSQLVVRIDTDLKSRFKAECARKNRSMDSVLSMLIEKALIKNGVLQDETILIRENWKQLQNKLIESGIDQSKLFDVLDAIKNIKGLLLESVTE